MTLDAVTIEQAEALLDAKVYVDAHRRHFPPDWYDWQLDEMHSHEPESMILAGNQTGKTECGAYHFAVDCTGDYPDDWEGFKYDHALHAVALGVDATQLEVIQGKLFGQVQGRTFTGGYIHPDEVLEVAWSTNITGVARKVLVKSKFGVTTIRQRVYTQAKTGSATLSFAGFTQDLIWCDEQPPDELIGQLHVRLINGNRGKGGRLRYTMTPELGQTATVVDFMETASTHQRLVGPVHWDRCPHLTPEVRERILAGIPPHERDMRVGGIPYMGAGLIYPIAEERILCDPFTLPGYFRVLKAVDLGMNPDPTAVVFLAYDPELDVVYLVDEYAESGRSVPDHAAEINKIWPHAPVVFPHDAKQGHSRVETKAGETIMRHYQDAGVGHAILFQNEDESIKVEPGILYLNGLMERNGFKCFRNTTNGFLMEKRMYHRKDGRPVKRMDHRLDAVRYGAVMIKRFGVPLLESYRKRPFVRRAMDRRKKRK